MRLLAWVLRLRMSREAADSIVGDLLESSGGARARAWMGAPAVAVTCLLAPPAAGAGLRAALSPAGLTADVRYAWRGLRTRPLTTGVAVVTLGLGIGASVAIFSLFRSVVLRPLPLSSPERLFTSSTAFSYPDVADLAEAARPVLEGLTTWSTTSRPVKLDHRGEVRLVLLEHTAGNYFEVLGVRARVGRLFDARDDGAAAPVAVISERLWRRAFDSDPGVVGSPIELNDVPVTVIGVTADDFRGTALHRDVGLWTPLSLHGELATGSLRRLDAEDRGTQWLRIAGRLREGVALGTAERVMLDASAALADAHGSPYLDAFESLEPLAEAAVSRREEATGFLWLVGGMVAGALLIACTNASGLLLARLAERRREIGMRMALGAPRSRLVRQLLLESLLMSMLAGALALVLGRLTLGVIGALQIPGRIAVGELGAATDAAVAVFAFSVAVVAGLAFGVLPAVRATRRDPSRLLGRRSCTTDRPRAAQALVVAQVALTMALVFGGGLFLRSLQTALDVDLGFDRADVIVADVEFGLSGRPDEAAAFYRETLAAIAALPSVDSAAWGLFVPVGGGMRMEDFRVVGAEEAGSVSLNYVSPGFFETLRLPLRSGRAFTDADDADAPPVAVVNETFAAMWWPDEDPVGGRFRFPGPAGPMEVEVVGVVADSKVRRLDEETAPYLYVPLTQWIWLVGSDPIRLAVRSPREAAEVVSEVRLTLQRVAPDVPVAAIRTLDDQLFDLLMPQRVGATLLGIYAAMAMAIAALGIYGVVSNAVATRRREIGIRRALGAGRKALLRRMAGYGLVPGALGVVIGTGLALGAGRLLAGFLPGLAASDPRTLAETILLLGLVAIFACAIPARRALKVDAAVALEEE